MQRLRAVLRLLILIGWLASLLLISPTHAYACSCLMPPGTSEEQLIAMDFESSAAVFAGEVTHIQTKPTGGFLPVTVIFKVSEVWKGAVSDQLSVRTGMNGSDCGFGFQTGQQYLVYARDTRGILSTGICYRTALLSNAALDLAELGTGTVPPAPPPAPSPITLVALIAAGALIAAAVLAAIFLLLRRWSRQPA